MSSHQWAVLWTLITVTVFLIGCPATSQAEGDVITLRDGTVLRGKIIEVVPDQKVKLETPGGFLVELDWDAIQSMSKEGDQIAGQDEVLQEIRRSRYQTRKILDLVGLTVAYGATIAADLAAGGEFYTGSAIPVIGPFIAAGQVDERDYFDPADAAGDRTLFLISGLVQIGFVGDYWLTSMREGQDERAVRFSCIPERDGMRFAVAWQF